MSALIRFREHLEQSLKIVSWSPTDAQLRGIALRLAMPPATDVARVHEVVNQVCPGTRFISEEGLDNSDLRTLLALATAAASGK